MSVTVLFVFFLRFLNGIDYLVLESNKSSMFPARIIEWDQLSIKYVFCFFFPFVSIKENTNIMGMRLKM